MTRPPCNPRRSRAGLLFHERTHSGGGAWEIEAEMNRDDCLQFYGDISSARIKGRAIAESLDLPGAEVIGTFQPQSERQPNTAWYGGSLCAWERYSGVNCGQACRKDSLAIAMRTGSSAARILNVLGSDPPGPWVVHTSSPHFLGHHSP